MSLTPPDPDHSPTQGMTAARGPSDNSGGAGLGLALVLFLIALVVGFLGVRAYYDVRDYDPTAAPTCGDEVMTPRDRCWFSGHGDGTYDDEVQAAADKQAQDTWIRNIGLPTTALLLTLSVLLIGRAVRRTAQESKQEERGRRRRS